MPAETRYNATMPHIGTNDCSGTNYDKQLVTVSFRALAKQLVRVFPKAAIAFTSITVLYKISFDCFFVCFFSNTGVELIRYVLLP